MNLFTVPILGRLLRSPWSWWLARITGLGLLLAMIAFGWYQHAIPGVPSPDPLMYGNLTTYFFWVLWLMGVVFVAMLLGRAWCAVCPLGWLNGLVARFGLRRPLPEGLRNFVPVTLTLVALQLAVYLLALHRYPDYTAMLLLLTLALTVACGLVFRQRAFCSLFCPAGAVFGLYARIAPFRLSVADQERCGACGTRDCVAGGTVWKRLSLGEATLQWPAERPDCPVELKPAQLRDGAACTLCLHCVENCRRDNVRWGSQPFLADLGQEPLSPSETLFFVALLGMLTANFSKVYTDLRELIFWLPEQAALLLGWQTSGFYLLAVPWVALLFPLLLLLPGYLLLRVSEARFEVLAQRPEPLSAPPASSASATPFWAGLGRLALPLIPLLLAAHLVLAVVKLNAKGGYLPYVLGDPSGVRSYLGMNVMQTLTAPGVLIAIDHIKWLVLALLLAGLLVGVAAARKVGRRLYGFHGGGYLAASLTTLVILGGLYGATIIRWLFIR